MFISKKSNGIIDACRFCWMCRHVCPVGNASGQERNTARARALACSLVIRDTVNLQDVSDNIYECALCGACTNNCVTGWDPKVFVEEFKTQLILQNKAPQHIAKLLEKYFSKGNIYGRDASSISSLLNNRSETSLVMGQDALYKLPDSVKDVVSLLKSAKVSVDINEISSNTGFTLYFLSGKTSETQEAMKKWADSVKNYQLVVIYDPCDLSFVAHQYKEWGIEVKPKVISFNNYLLQIIKEGKLNLRNSQTEYSLQDHFGYSREIEEESGRELISHVGKSREMLLIKKVANLAGHLIMNEYMPDIMKKMATKRLNDAHNMGVTTLVTESPSEYLLLKENANGNIRVLSIEQMLSENLKV